LCDTARETQAGECARPRAEGDPVERPERKVGLPQQRSDACKQMFGMVGMSLEHALAQPVVQGQGHAGMLARGFDG